jgi:hypothetical protein
MTLTLRARISVLNPKDSTPWINTSVRMDREVTCTSDA